jgi:hypothetical protein
MSPSRSLSRGIWFERRLCGVDGPSNHFARESGLTIGIM